MAAEMIVLGTHNEWLRNRGKGIGGSEIASVIGQNPYMTNVELWELKTGRRKKPDISDNQETRVSCPNP